MPGLDNTPHKFESPHDAADKAAAAQLSSEAISGFAPLAPKPQADTGDDQKVLDAGLGAGTHAIYQSELAGKPAIDDKPAADNKPAVDNEPISQSEPAKGTDVSITRTPSSMAEIRHPQATAETLPVGMAWTGADNVPGKTPPQTTAMHDFVISAPMSLGLRWNNSEYNGLASGFTPQSIENAQNYHQELVSENPQIKDVAEVRYRDAPSNYLPPDSKFWLRDNQGNIESGAAGKLKDYNYLDFRNPELQDQVAAQAKAVVDTGATDGVFLDWFSAGSLKDPQLDKARIDMLEKVRSAIGPNEMIVVNTNGTQMPDDVAKLVNGYYMEIPQSSTPRDWQNITAAVDQAEEQGKFPIVETWPDDAQGRQELNKMRATMALVLTHAPDGYGLFADKDGTAVQEHSHDWYQFYDTQIGKPTSPLESIQGGSLREYQKGTVIYNPMGNQPIDVTFQSDRTSAATGKTGKSFIVEPEDGDIFLKPGSQ